MTSIPMIGLTAPRFAVSASVVAATDVGAAAYALAATFGHTEGTGASVTALVERIPGGVNADARPRTSVCRRSDL
ncbi:MAG: hypothetical protein ABI181_05005 [Mycobacteriaceae bacterium]